MAEDGLIYVPMKGTGVERPHYAWMSPWAGAVIVSILGGAQSGIAQGNDVAAPWLSLVLAVVALIAYVYLFIIGVQKTVECLKGRRHVGHGIGGIAVSSLHGLLFVAVMLYAVFTASTYDPRAEAVKDFSPEQLVQKICEDIRPDMPLEIAPDIYIDGVYADPPDRLNVQMLIMEDNIDKDLLRAKAEKMPQELKDDPMFAALAKKGCNVRYIWRDINGDVLLDIEYSPDDFK